MKRASNVLMVEGNNDLFTIVRLMQHHTHWGDKKEDWPVTIRPSNSVDSLLKEKSLTAEIKSNGIIGVVLDADDHSHGKFTRLEQVCKAFFPGMPAAQPAHGLIVENLNENKRLGVWIMPDNQAGGDIEMFLNRLVPANQQHLWDLARKSTANALDSGAKCKPQHHDRASLYAYLAWQEDPGQAPGLALVQGSLDPYASVAIPFVTWFMELYQLSAL